jgi:hypothetical protein
MDCKNLEKGYNPSEAMKNIKIIMKIADFL